MLRGEIEFRKYLWSTGYEQAMTEASRAPDLVDRIKMHHWMIIALRKAAKPRYRTNKKGNEKMEFYFSKGSSSEIVMLQFYSNLWVTLCLTITDILYIFLTLGDIIIFPEFRTRTSPYLAIVIRHRGSCDSTHLNCKAPYNLHH